MIRDVPDALVTLMEKDEECRLYTLEYLRTHTS